MTSQYLSEIRIMPYTFAPKGWALCNGQILAIQQNQALFALLGTTYGGNGTTTFGLPDLRGRVPLGFNSSNLPLGAQTGEANHTLTITETPLHTHTVMVDSQTTATTAPGSPATVLGISTGVTTPGPVTYPVNIYNTAAVNTTLAPQSIAPVGGQPHSNMQPYLALNFCIALTGIFPSRN